MNPHGIAMGQMVVDIDMRGAGGFLQPHSGGDCDIVNGVPQLLMTGLCLSIIREGAARG